MSKLQPAWKAQHIQGTQTHRLRASHFLLRVCEWVMVTSFPALVSLKLMSEKQRSCWQAVTMLHSPTRWRNVLIKPLPYVQTRIYHYSGPHILREIKQYLVSGLFWRKEEMPSYSWDSLACLLGFFFFFCQALNFPRFLHQGIFVSLLWANYEQSTRQNRVSHMWTTAASPPSRATEWVVKWPEDLYLGFQGLP